MIAIQGGPDDPQNTSDGLIVYWDKGASPAAKTGDAQNMIAADLFLWCWFDDFYHPCK